jgi:hypothetical protein
MSASKQAKTLFEMYDQYFDGTVNSVVDTGLKLWDGTHNRWKMEVEYDAITAQYADNITLFTVKPDYKPYSGIRVRKDKPISKNSDFTLTVSEACTVISNPGEFSFGTSIYGYQLYIGNTNSVNTLTLIRDGQYLYCDYNGQLATLKITDPKTNNLNLLIGCDYKGANNETQRYYTGTVQKFVISELGDSIYDAEIEYLEGTGTQWIDTGVYFDTTKHGCEIDAILINDKTGAVTLCGIWEGSWDNDHLGSIINGNFNDAYFFCPLKDFRGGNNKLGTALAQLNVRNKVGFINHGLSNGEITVTRTVNTISDSIVMTNPYIGVSVNTFPIF